MKRVVLREDIYSKKILCSVLENSPHRPMTIDEMRSRVGMVDAILAGGHHVDLPDEQWSLLRDCLVGFPWSQAKRSLITIIDDVTEATEPPKEEPDGESGSD